MTGTVQNATRRESASSRRPSVGSALGAGVLVLVLVACQSAPPPLPEPVPEPVPVGAAEVEQRAAAPKVWAVVAGSSLNVRDRADGKGAKLATLQRGTRVRVLAEQGDWREITSGAVRGWVAVRYLKIEAPCLADKGTAEVLDLPPLAMATAGPHGAVVMEATVSAAGRVREVKVLSNSTGSADLERQARTELAQLHFAPPVRKCRPVPFIYTFTRSF